MKPRIKIELIIYDKVIDWSLFNISSKTRALEEMIIVLKEFLDKIT